MKKYFDGDDIIITDKKEFVGMFCETLTHRPPEILAELVWKGLNTQWSDGYDQGKYDPEFD